MVWEHVAVEITRPHVAYATTGFALLLFGTLSLFLKEKLYIGEATVATIYGLIVGPHCLNWFSPTTWGNSDYITLELSRIVLIVQIFAVAVELPKKYMLRHWWSIFVLLVPVMTYGWIVSSVFIWKLIPTLRWIDALVIAGCVTATDPVLASAVVGKGKFARRVPGHLRNVLSAESGCNDGMAYPFVALAVTVLQYEGHSGHIAKEFIGTVVFYQCVLGCIIGAVIGYCARHLIKFAEQRDLIDRESFLVYYFCVALFCAGVGTLTGVDDLLVAFSAGAAFSWDGWFARQTENAHVSNVIDVLMNTAFFVYFGAIVPWPDFNDAELGIRAWKLVIIAIIILVVRRLPIMLVLKPVIPDIKSWREAFFCGHFGPIGVGGLFMAILARAMLENGTESPEGSIPRDSKFYMVIRTLWPVTCFLVIASIIVHGSSIAVFTLGKRLNNMAITMTYTTGGNNPSWMSRLPSKFSESGNPLRLQKVDTEMPLGARLRRRKRGPRTEETAEDHENESAVDTSSEIIPENERREARSEQIPLEIRIDLGSEGRFDQTDLVPAESLAGKSPEELNAYREGRHIVVEDGDGNVVHNFKIGDRHGEVQGQPKLTIHEPVSDRADDDGPETPRNSNRLEVPNAREGGRHRRASSQAASVLHLPHRSQQVYAYQLDDNVIVENADGDVIRRYRYVPRGSVPARALRVPWWKRPLRALGFETHQQPHFAASASGISTSGSAGSDEEKFDVPRVPPSLDVEHAPQDLLVPLPDNSDEHSVSLDHSTTLSNRDEAAVRRQIESMLTTGELSHRPSTTSRWSNRDDDDGPPAAADDYNSVSDDDYENAVSDERFQGGDDDDEPETEVERARRLAALGVISDEPSTHSGNQSDRGVEFPASPAEAAVSQLSNDCENNDEDEPRVMFSLPRRR